MKTKKIPFDVSTMPCQHLTGVGKRIAERLARLGIHHVQDVLFHLPFRYQDRTHIHPLRTVSPGEHVVVEGDIDQITFPKGGRTRLFCRIRDMSGHIHLRFFYINPLQKETLKIGTRIRCFGETRFGTHGIEMIHPEYRLLSECENLPIDDHLTPIYPTTEGVSQLMWRKLTAQALQMIADGEWLQDILPETILQKFTFPTLHQALQFVHRPPKETALDLLIEGSHNAQKRLVFEELLAHRLGLLQLKNSFQIQKAYALQDKKTLTQKFLMKRFGHLAKNYVVASTQQMGMDPDWVEAMAFAWLAKQTLEGKSGNIPLVTGAKRAIPLGGIYIP